MRALLAVALAVSLALAVAAPHVHLAPDSGEGCTACLVRGGDVARVATPDVAPVPVPAGEAAAAPQVLLADGAPQGAIPGQSPPVAA